MLMERAGTGGALFRNLYRDFLKEAIVEHKLTELEPAYEDFKGIAKSWTAISKLFEQIGSTQDEKHVDAAAQLFLGLSEREKLAMEKLETCFD